MSNKRYGGNKSHPLYYTHRNLLSRCYNKNQPKYRYYGGRGIRVCDRWLEPNRGFLNFARDMGPKPSPKHSIDRIDVNGDYEPSNCRWATHYVQMANTTASSGVPGVSWHKQRNKWRSRIKVNARDIHLGLFDTKEEAAKARQKYVYKNHRV